MAEAALFGVAKSVLQALASPALDEFRLLWGQKKQLERLHDTVTTIGDVLHDADRRQADDAAVQGWLTRLRVVLYDADDLFDLISAQLLHNKLKTGNKIVRKVRPFLSKPRHFVSFVKTAHKVKDIREQLDAIASDIKGFGLLPVQTALDQSHRFQREQTHSYFPSNEVIGREKEREDIVKLLLLPECLPAEQNGVSVVAVIGFGGLGKTTLAQLVYNDQRVQKGFDPCVWACINYFSCLEEVLKTLMKSVTKSEVGGFDLDTLQSKFRKKIEGKRFLLVVDDVWDEDPQNWHKLKILLDCGKPGSMVLATTRSVKAAQSLSAVEPHYHLAGMSDQSAWLLFKKMAFGGKHLHHNPRLEGLGQQIVKKCVNVPLLIVTIASFLRYQEESKWCSLVDGELPTVAPGDYNKVMQVLKISYNEFPYPVKRCFAFCSLFPKDFRLKKDELIRLWIAEGFVEVADVCQNLEGIAEEYFFYLVDRCFFQNMDMFTVKGVAIYTCQMHDLVHDLAKEVAGSECILVDQVNAQKPWDNKTLRHVCFVGDVCSVSHSKSLRTFLHFKSDFVGTNTLNGMMSSFKALRVLDLSQLGIKEIPASIGELIHLRLLDLSRIEMERLPSSICSLHHLQSLILRYCKSLKELPEEIGKLISLRHLVLDGCSSLGEMPAGMATLTSLVTLDKRVVHKPGGELRYLEGLDNLSGYLGIDICETGWENVTVDGQTACLSRKGRLKALTITFERVESGGEVETLLGALEPHPNLEGLEIERYGGNRIPGWVTSLDRLVILRLDGCENSIELPPLSRLSSLKELSIERMYSMLSIEGSVSYDPEPLLFFPSLEALCLDEMPKLRSWWVQAPSVLPKFPRVTKVEIKDCPELAAAGMPLFPLVEVLELSGVQEEVVWHGIGTPPQESSLLGNSSALKKCKISNIGGLRSIGEAQIRHLSALRRLRVYDSEELETVSWRGLAYLTSLEKLDIVTRYDVKLRWDVDGDEVPLGARLRRLQFSNVTRSCLKGLKYLTSLETLCLYNFDEELQTSNSEEEEEGMPWKPLQKLDTLRLGFGGTFTPFSMRGNQQLLRGVKYLTNSLRELTLFHCKELYLSWTTLVSLDHLEKLYFAYVERVINVVDAPQLLQLSSTSLHQMRIDGGSAEWILDIPWKSFPSLRSLQLRRISNLEALPEGIQHLASLQTLKIFECERVVSLPNWINSISSLSLFHIWRCSKELKMRCQQVTGEDWPLIQHIRQVDIA